MSSTENATYNHAAALAREREEKKKLVIDIITAKCCEGQSEFEDIQAFGKALKAGDTLNVQILYGGESNFSYKVSLTEDPSKALFAKISFSFALWNPDRSVKYDLNRVDNEFSIMNDFAELMGGFDATRPPPVAKPYYCIDIPEHSARLLVTEWVKADVQFSKQFARGKVDARVVSGVARAIAKLNLVRNVDPDYNDEGYRPCFRSLVPVFRSIYGQFVEIPDEQADACAAYCKVLGMPKLNALLDAFEKELVESKQVLCHNDTKHFNILVEGQPSVGEFGPNGSFALCDWEFSVVGRSGKDVGIYWGWPGACIMCHAAQGRKEEAYHLLDKCVLFWEEYAAYLVEAGKDDEYLVDAFKGALGAYYLYLEFCYYGMALNQEDLPIDGLSPELCAKAKGSMGLAALKAGEVAYLGKHPDYDLEQLKGFFKESISAEIESLLAAAAAEHESRSQSESSVRVRRCSETLLEEAATHEHIAMQD